MSSGATAASGPGDGGAIGTVRAPGGPGASAGPGAPGTSGPGNPGIAAAGTPWFGARAAGLGGAFCTPTIGPNWPWPYGPMSRPAQGSGLPGDGALPAGGVYEQG